MLSPVDPQQELVRLQRSAKGEEIMGAVGENMVNQLTVHTQAIMKKVAFNPNVFQCWQFASNASKTRRASKPAINGINRAHE